MMDYRPVIGILSHPIDSASGRLNNATNGSYIAASYVKLVESAGARVIPLVYTDPLETLLKKLDLVNGVVFTDGLAKSGLYYETVGRIFKDTNILESFSATHQASTLQFVENANVEGSVFQRYFEILTTCKDRDDKVYVSTMRSRNYPVTGFQWHPEKNAFVRGSPKIPHSEDAIQVTQYAANFLVSEARKSMNRPPAQEMLDNLIYNYSPTYSEKAGGRGFDEVYLFA